MDFVKHNKKPFPLFVLSFLSFLALGYIFLTFPPGTSLTVATIQIPYLPIFFVLLFITLYGLVGFFLKSGLQGFIVATTVVSFLLFRLFNLTNQFFTVLLFILFLCIEGVLWKRK